MSHTKGTLIVRRAVDSRYRYVILDEKGQLGEAYPGFVSSTGETTWDAEANARLWATAPGLLEACNAAVEFVQNDRFTSGNDPACNCNGCRTIRVLKAAIAKATVTEAEVGR